MPIHGRQPKAMPLDQARASAHAALLLAGSPPDWEPQDARQAPPSLVSHWPAWVAKAGTLLCHNGCVLWCEPQRDPRETFPSQLILTMPEGRYVIEVLDVARREWLVRQTVSGRTLVTGLPYTAGDLVIQVRPAAEVAARPTAVVEPETIPTT